MNPDFLNRLRNVVPPERVLTDAASLARYSQDFCWYSPVLEPLLSDKRADVVVLARTADEVEAVVRLAAQEAIPLTARGAGTGNYGQCIPLQGGLVLDFTGLDRVLEVSSTHLTAEAGTRVSVCEDAARAVGGELRSYPSTFQKATLGGFLAGGSGGIGSMNWGFLWENDNVSALEILTLEAEPRRLKLNGPDLLPILHAYGTNGLLLSATLPLAPKVAWGQAAVTFPTFEACFTFSESIAQDAAWQKRYVSCYEWPVPAFFTPIQSLVREGQALAVFEIEETQLPALAEAAVRAGGEVTLLQPHADRKNGPLLSDYTWNHTTLWAIKAEPTITYLQCGFDAQGARTQFAKLKDRFGDEFLLHLDFVKSGGVVSAGGAPLIRYRNEARLKEITDYCAEIGVYLADPHIYQLEAGSGIGLDAIQKARTRFDPRALLNPGKIPGA
jgi:FAD/FMN-containing dehydrogenase